MHNLHIRPLFLSLALWARNDKAAIRKKKLEVYDGGGLPLKQAPRPPQK